MPSEEWTLTHGRDEYVSEYGIIGFRGNQRSSDCIWWNHMPAALVKERIGNEIWNAYFKFCVIRNPYDRAVSLFYHQLKNKIPIELIHTRDLDKDREEFDAWLQTGAFNSDKDKYIIYGKFCLDDVIRYEKLEGDIKKICLRIGAPYNPAWLPRFKAGFRPKYAITQNIYTERAKKIVEAASSFENEFFGYSFPISD